MTHERNCTFRSLPTIRLAIRNIFFAPKPAPDPNVLESAVKWAGYNGRAGYVPSVPPSEIGPALNRRIATLFAHHLTGACRWGLDGYSASEPLDSLWTVGWVNAD